MAVSEKPVADLLKFYSTPSVSCHGREQKHEMEILCESCKLVLEQQCDSFIASAGGRPILITYSSDGTPVKKVGYRLPFHGPDGKPSLKKGRESKEVLVQQVLFEVCGSLRSSSLQVSHL